jgi:hypothetical protein
MNKEDVLVRASEVPDVAALIEDFKACSPMGDGNWNRVNDNENTRFTRWPGQYPDGKKHDSGSVPAFPFDGASDTRIPLADDIINENVGVCVVAFWRAMVKQKFGGTEESAYAVKLADYYINTVMALELVTEVELSEQYRQTYGWCVLHPRWEREICLAHRTVTMEELVGLAQQVGGAGEETSNFKLQTSGNLQASNFNAEGETPAATPVSPLAILPELIMDPTLEGEAVKVLGMLYELFAAKQVEGVDIELPALRESKIRKAIKELREEGETTLPLPYVSKNRPEIVALKPWDEIFLRNYTTDIQKGPRVFRRVFMDEVSLRSKVLTEKWDKDWVEEALKQKGKVSSWSSSSMNMSSPPERLTDAMSGNATPSVFCSMDTKEDLVEVVYATSRQLDEDNVMGVYVTIFNPNVTKDVNGKELYALHELIPGSRGEMPYVALKRENWHRSITSSRGVPQVAGTWQREVKVQRDGLVDHTSIGVTPPVLIPKGAMQSRLKFGPAVQNEFTPGREPKWMEVPQSGTSLAIELMAEVRRDSAFYFGRMHEDVPPVLVGIKQTMLTQPFLMGWSVALQMVLRLAQEFMPDAEFARITGAPAGWLDSKRGDYGALDMGLHFDVRELDPEFVLAQMKILNEAVLPSDAAGVIDRAKYTMLQLRAINPALAKELVTNQEEASQKLFNQVKNDIALMYLGNEPQYVEMDPTAQTKLGYTQQILQANPKYQEELQEDKEGVFAQLLEKYVMNLQMSLKQEENKQVGRIGVSAGGGGPESGAGPGGR